MQREFTGFKAVTIQIQIGIRIPRFLNGQVYNYANNSHKVVDSKAWAIRGASSTSRKSKLI